MITIGIIFIGVVQHTSNLGYYPYPQSNQTLGCGYIFIKDIDILIN